MFSGRARVFGLRVDVLLFRVARSRTSPGSLGTRRWHCGRRCLFDWPGSTRRALHFPRPGQCRDRVERAAGALLLDAAAIPARDQKFAVTLARTASGDPGVMLLLLWAFA